MTTATRYLVAQVQEISGGMMVFVAGPRQVGKTTLALSVPGAADGYLNRDVGAHRRSLRYLKAKFPEARAWQVSASGRKDYVSPQGIRVAPAVELLSELV